jgi:YibE/F-like protein
LSLLVAVGLAEAFTHLAHLAGTSSEEALYLSSATEISLRGLLLAGMVIGALGVLVDLTVSQASTVIALRQANPSLGFRQLFTGALSVGHDHIAATVNTLVFAYAGASLPVLLIFSIGGTTFTDGINSEAVSEEVVATLVGSIGADRVDADHDGDRGAPRPPPPRPRARGRGRARPRARPLTSVRANRRVDDRARFFLSGCHRDRSRAAVAPRDGLCALAAAGHKGRMKIRTAVALSQRWLPPGPGSRRRVDTRLARPRRRRGVRPSPRPAPRGLGVRGDTSSRRTRAPSGSC